jgi:sigma-B regulation protein RsbU (phosphoserine phosphatase)
MVWQANLFGRSTLNLVLRRELAAAYDALDREVKIVGEIQRSLLPRTLPVIPGVRLAAHYQTSRRAGGDYYDVFALPDGRWGLIIADVSGHGTPAAVMMAVTHAIAHSYPGPAMPPASVLAHLNSKLAAHYTADNGTFVTAFYAVIDPARGEMVYARAGHNPPRLHSGGTLRALDAVGALPLGIDPGQVFEEARLDLRPGDHLLLYTDGVTEAAGPGGDLFGEARLDGLLRQGHGSSEAAVAAIVAALAAHSGPRPPEDDQTLLAAWVGS